VSRSSPALRGSRLLAGVTLGLLVWAALWTCSRPTQEKARGPEVPRVESTPPAAASPEPVPRQSVETTAIRPAPASRTGAMNYAQLSGRIVDPLGIAVGGCEVSIEAMARSGFAAAGATPEPDMTTVVSDAEGRFAADVPPNRPLVLTLSHRDFPTQVALRGRSLDVGSAEDLGRVTIESGPGVSVLVLTYDDGRPVRRAMVSLSPTVSEVGLPRRAQLAGERFGTTGTDGRAVLPGVAAGAYRLRVDAEGLATVDQEVMIGADAARESRARTVRMVPGFALFGRVEDPDGQPIEDAVVVAEPAGGGPTVEGAVGARGEFRLRGLAPGECRLTVLSAAWGTAERRDVTVPSPAVTVRMAEGLMIAGLAVSAVDGLPLSGARVEATPSLGWPLVRRGEVVRPAATTGPDGRFALRGLPPGSFTLRLLSEGFIPSRHGPVEAGGAPIEIRALPGITVKGRVLTRDKNPLPDAMIRAVDADYDGSEFARLAHSVAYPAEPAATSGPDGTFELRGLRPGRDRLVIEHDDHLPITTDVVGEDALQPVDLGDLELTAGTLVSGVAIDAAGRPALGAIVCLDGREKGTVSRHARTDGDGRFVLRGVPPGSYDLFYYYPERQLAAERADMRSRTRLRIAVQEGRPLEAKLQLATER
jgi:protocatechuate 3,4-dioxygenase beta subunit